MEDCGTARLNGAGGLLLQCLSRTLPGEAHPYNGESLIPKYLLSRYDLSGTVLDSGKQQMAVNERKISVLSGTAF